MTTWARAGWCADFNYTFLTSKERDNETGLDYFLARYYSSTQGRFTSPDEFTGGPAELYSFVDDASDNPTFYADLRNPQSLNKYQYSYNNPLRYVDPDGHDPNETLVQNPTTVSVPGGIPLPILTPQQAQQTVEAIKQASEAFDRFNSAAQAKGKKEVQEAAGYLTLKLLHQIAQTIGTPNDDAIPAAPPTPLVQPAPPLPITMAKNKNRAVPTVPPLTGPAKADEDKRRKREQRKRTREKKKEDRTNPNPTGPNDPHDDDGEHHRDPSQGGRRGPRRN